MVMQNQGRNVPVHLLMRNFPLSPHLPSWADPSEASVDQLAPWHLPRGVPPRMIFPSCPAPSADCVS